MSNQPKTIFDDFIEAIDDLMNPNKSLTESIDNFIFGKKSSESNSSTKISNEYEDDDD